MRRGLLALAIATVVAGVTAATGLAAGSTQVDHFTDGPFADNIWFRHSLTKRGRVHVGAIVPSPT